MLNCVHQVLIGLEGCAVPKLSVIIPVYNVENFLSACLDSCLDAAPAGEYEIIAVNDGSTDGSPLILADYAARYPELIRTVTTPNGGLGHARNTGLGQARGEYVLFLDSDDSLSPGALGEMLPALEGGEDIIFFDFVTVSERGERLGKTSGCPGGEGSFTLEERPELILAPPNAWNKLWRRELFETTGIRFPDRLWYEDLASSPKLYLHARRFRYVAREWYRYLVRGGSIINSGKIERNRDMLAAIGTSLDYYRERGVYERWEKELCYLSFYHELLTSTTRVNLLDPKSPVQDALLEDFLRRFPDFRSNPYFRAAPAKYRFLAELIVAKRRKTLHLVMRANELIKRKKR